MLGVVFFGVFLVAAGGGSACDPLPDECEDDDNVCDGNIANLCFAPYAESRRKTQREDCGTGVCVLATSSNGTYPVCARAGTPTCATVGERSCTAPMVATSCVALADGRSVWVDEPAASRTAASTAGVP